MAKWCLLAMGKKLHVSAYSGHIQGLTTEDGRYRPKHVVFLLLINTII